MGTCGEKTVQLRMGLKILASNEHSAEAAILPSAAWHLVWALGTMKKETGEVLVDGLCGGGAKSPLWKKMIANIMNLKVDVIESEEGPALGGAMLAAVGCGEYPNVETIAAKLVKVVDTVEPEKELVAKYEEKYQRFKKIYPAVKGLF